MVDIIVGTIPAVQKHPDQRSRQQQPPPPKKKKERRENAVDRRKAVRDGIVVTLSNQSERRQGPDRRKK